MNQGNAVGQINRKLQSGMGVYFHWCLGCEEMHALPNAGKFISATLENPAFIHSFMHSGEKRIFIDGKWTGEWERDSDGNTIPFFCHYIFTPEVLDFCTDSTHALAGKSVPLPDLPEGITG